jgi:predicted nucleotidyltransferase
MTRSEVLKKLREMRPWLADHGVVDIALFGSFARDQGRDDSDIDLLVTFDPMPGLSFFSLERELSRRMNRTVEICTLDALHPIARAQVLSEAVGV